MMTGTIVSSVIALLLAVVISYQSDETVVILSRNVAFSDMKLEPGEKNIPEGSSMSLKYRERPKVEPEKQVPSTDYVKIPPVVADKPLTGNVTLVEDIPDYYERAGIETNEIGLPAVSDYDDYLNRPAEGPDSPNMIYRLSRSFAGGSREVDRPLYIKFMNGISYPNEGRGMVDTVLVIMTLHERGYIENIETIYDTWPAYGFARKFKQALFDAYIKPEIRNGRKVGGSYLLYCIFDSNRMVTEVRNSSDIKISLES